MATHSSTLAWKIPWMEEPGRLQFMGLRRVGYDWASSLSLFTFMHWRRKWQPTPVFLPGESQGQRSLVGCCLWGHMESDTTEVTWQQQQQQQHHPHVDGYLTASCDFGALAGGDECMSFYSTILNQKPVLAPSFPSGQVSTQVYEPSRFFIYLSPWAFLYKRVGAMIRWDYWGLSPLNNQNHTSQCFILCYLPCTLLFHESGHYVHVFLSTWSYITVQPSKC